MSFIQTVCGNIPAEDLGFCQSHEHLCLEYGQSARINENLCIDDPEKTTQELKDFYSQGGRAIVDAQPVGCGRNSLTLRQLSEKATVSIIGSTGFHKQIFYQTDHWIHTADMDTLAEIFENELTIGMSPQCDTFSSTKWIHGCRAGQVKTALDTIGMSSWYQKLFEAAIFAAKKTGAPLMVHVEAGANPILLADYFVKLGLPLSQTIFCHLDRACHDMNVHIELCKAGAYLEYDTIAREKYHTDDHEIALIHMLLNHNCENMLLMSLDVTRARLIRYGGKVGLTYILKAFIPKLMAAGFSKEIIKLFFVNNPASAFAIRTN